MYIKREDALKSICEYCSEKGMCEDANVHCAEYADIKAIPAADVAPIVYCKDCYWWYTGTTKDGTIDVSHCSRGVSAGNGQYFYCALGQRRVNLKDGNR